MDYELKMKDKDNSIIYASLNSYLFCDSKDQPLGIEGSIRDITKRKKIEENLKESLKEKEILLKEIHHRVKNNMQIISSLLNLQTRYVDGEESLNVLQESQNRVRSMAMIHEKLYGSNDFNKILFPEYIESLVLELFHSYSISKENIKIFFEIDNIKLNIETLLPLGLIITELVSNCFKYAFPEEQKGKLEISLKTAGDNYKLVVQDNGIGFPKNIDFKNTNSLGLQLVINLVEQIEGNVQLDVNSGTIFTINFRELEYKERI